MTKEPNEQSLQLIKEAVENTRAEIGKVIIGQQEIIDLLLAGLLSDGHILLEGVPGIAKTMMARLLAKTLSVDFSRIQFTPDLMPTDIVGTSVFNVKSSEFQFRKGPVFSNFILIDEINRAPAKTQAALFEVMEERQVTVDGTTHQMGFPFLVIATQNPVEQEGTYRLPEAQLDRFIFKVKISYPSLDEELAILNRFAEDFNQLVSKKVKPVIDSELLRTCRQMVEKVFIDPTLQSYIAQLVHQTRHSGDIFLGASPRASLAILKSSKAIAAMDGRSFVTPDDIRRVSFPVLNHRIILSPEREMEGAEVEDVIQAIIEKIEVPR